MKQRTKQKLEERVGENVKKKSRIDIIGQNGNTGEHYEAMPNARWNWYGEGEDQPVLKNESNISKCWDQNEAARRKMNRHNAYNAKFWIYEEQRYGTWEDSQKFYRKQDKKEARLRASSFAQSKEGRTFRRHLVAEE